MGSSFNGRTAGWQSANAGSIPADSTTLRRQEKSSELFSDEKPPSVPKVEIDDDVLSQYDPQELANFEKVVDALAQKKGWVRSEDLQAKTFQERSSDVLDEFLEAHPEYTPEKDKDNVLWDRFKGEFSLYKTPQDPREYRKIFNKVHREIFGIQTSDDSKIKAQEQKVRSASHSGASKTEPSKSSKLDPRLKTGLKGFSEEEIDELFG